MDAFSGDELLTVSPLQKVTIQQEQHSQIRSEGYLMEWKECGIWSQYLICWGHQQATSPLSLDHVLSTDDWKQFSSLSLERGTYQPPKGCHWFCQQSWMTTLCTRCILPVCRKAPRHLPSSSQPCAGAVSVRSPPSWPHHCEWSGPREAFACTLTLAVHKIRLDSRQDIYETLKWRPSALDWMLPIIFMNSSGSQNLAERKNIQRYLPT